MSPEAWTALGTVATLIVAPIIVWLIKRNGRGSEVPAAPAAPAEPMRLDKVVEGAADVITYLQADLERERANCKNDIATMRQSHDQQISDLNTRHAREMDALERRCEERIGAVQKALTKAKGTRRRT